MNTANRMAPSSPSTAKNTAALGCMAAAAFGAVSVVACFVLGLALSARDAALDSADAEERRADQATAALARENRKSHDLSEHVRTHLAIDNERCCECGGPEMSDAEQHRVDRRDVEP
jgi:hypothetical protein